MKVNEVHRILGYSMVASPSINMNEERAHSMAQMFALYSYPKNKARREWAVENIMIFYKMAVKEWKFINNIV